METKETFTDSEIEKAVKDYERVLRMASERGFQVVQVTVRQDTEGYGAWATFSYYQLSSDEHCCSDDYNTLYLLNCKTDEEIAKFLDEARDTAIASWKEHVAKKNASKNLAEENEALRKEVEELRKRLNEQKGAENE